MSLPRITSPADSPTGDAGEPMPIPMGRSENMDTEGGTMDDRVRRIKVGDPRWTGNPDSNHPMRERLVEVGLQPWWTLRRIGPAHTLSLALPGSDLFTIPLESESSMEKQPNDADSDGADGT